MQRQTDPLFAELGEERAKEFLDWFDREGKARRVDHPGILPSLLGEFLAGEPLREIERREREAERDRQMRAEQEQAKRRAAEEALTARVEVVWANLTDEDRARRLAVAERDVKESMSRWWKEVAVYDSGLRHSYVERRAKAALQAELEEPHADP